MHCLLTRLATRAKSECKEIEVANQKEILLKIQEKKYFCRQHNAM
jgi:hypothetical protein